MKKFVYLVVVVMLIAHTGLISAKPASATSPATLTIIVMDTTSALLDGAEIKIGRKKYITSFDGRIVLEAQQYKGIKKFSVSRKDYESKTIALGHSELVIVTLTPKFKSTTRRERPETSSDGAVLGVYMERAAVAKPEAEGVLPDAGAGANSMRAGKLTAGEVNDFAKWYFWPKVTDDSHKQYAGTWRMTPRYRYTVQVKTRTGAPVASRAVTLTDAHGNTLFQAVTDNTGKAELWGNLLSDEPVADNLQIRVDSHVLPAKPWANGLNTFVLDEACEASDAVDVVFIFDATGSMGDELRYLQAEMRDVIARAKDATGGLSIRTGAVVYRDHGDDYITRISRLTDDIKTTQTFIDRQEAWGGGDFPEAVPEALMAALNSSGWNADARARIAFLVLDAPCHEDSVTIALLHDQILNAAASGVRIVPVVCSGLDKGGELLMRSIALATNGTSFFLTDDSGIGETHLKPTTDTMTVEHLNDMLVRTIVEFSLMPKCHAGDEASTEETGRVEIAHIPNPFDVKDLETDPTVPHGEGVHYLVDISGKLLGIYEGGVPTDFLSTGVYFIRTYVDGKWYTKKLLVH